MFVDFILQNPIDNLLNVAFNHGVVRWLQRVPGQNTNHKAKYMQIALHTLASNVQLCV